MKIFKLFKTKEQIEYDAFCRGLYQMSKSVKNMINLCKKSQKKYPKIMTDEKIIDAIKKILVFENKG